MSGRRGGEGGGGRRGISGPQSALTDFLAANNISARQIRDNVEQRLARNQAANQAVQNEEQEAQAAVDLSAQEEEEEKESQAQELASSSRGSKRKRKSEKAMKAAAKKKAKRDAGDDDEDDSDFDLGDMYQKSRPAPGQFENCELCQKRFTVTPYSKEGPDGGLLCTPCGKQYAKDNKSLEAKARRAANGAGRKRRQKESNRLDGIVRTGARSLVDICVDSIARYQDEIEELGDLPDNLIDRLSQIFSKKRVLRPENLGLFLRPDLSTISIHDAANLNEDDFKQIFAVAYGCKKLVLRNAGQFKDSCLDYMTEKARHITFFQVYGANLVTDAGWSRFFRAYGPQLETVKITWCDASFTDHTVEELVNACPDLRCLKIKYCRKVTAASLASIARLSHLEHLSVRPSTSPSAEDIMLVIQALGPQLKTLSLEACSEVSDVVVDEIRAQCKSLAKLRLAGVIDTSDAAFTSLFSSSDPTSKTVLPPLQFADVSASRDMDANDPDGSEDNPWGFASNAFRSLMAHSGSRLRTLDISSCRHISHGAFCDVFDANNGANYPALETINLAFCSTVDTAVIRGIFACCPKVQKIIAFGCFHVEDVVVPQGVAVIGVPRAQDAIEKHGEAGVDLEKALGFMGQMLSASA